MEIITLAAVVAALGSLFPIIAKVVKELITRSADSAIILKNDDGTTIKIEGKSLDEEQLRLILKVLKANPKTESANE